MEPNGQRVQDDLDSLGSIGRVGATGVRRLAYSAEDETARRYLIQAMEAAGMVVRIDPFGNIIGRRAGSEPDSAPVMLGSHIDTPPLGGWYDGTVGVIGALEVVRMLNEAGVETVRPLEVVAFQAEEPGRFGVSCLGSKAMAGKFDVDYLHRLQDRDGITLYEAIRRIGLNPDDLPACRKRPGDVAAYLELHIEQGRVLQDAKLPLGVVTAIAAPTRCTVTLAGQADHSGATPMNQRRDALCGASEIVLAVERLARREFMHGTVGTVGALSVSPGVLNVVPGRVELSVDIRSVDPASKERVRDELVREIQRVAFERNLTCDIAFSVDEAPVPCDRGLVDLLQQTAQRIGIPAMAMPSGAGHDAQHVAAFAPAAMLFIPCRDGISHAPEEHAELEDICLGIRVLADAAVALARGDSYTGDSYTRVS